MLSVMTLPLKKNIEFFRVIFSNTIYTKTIHTGTRNLMDSTKLGVYVQSEKLRRFSSFQLKPPVGTHKSELPKEKRTKKPLNDDFKTTS